MARALTTSPEQRAQQASDVDALSPPGDASLQRESQTVQNLAEATLVGPSEGPGASVLTFKRPGPKGTESHNQRSCVEPWAVVVAVARRQPLA